MIGTAETRKKIAAAVLCASQLLACRKAAAPSAAAVSAPPVPKEASRASPMPAARADTDAYPFKSGERAAVEAFLQQHPDLRLATDGDRQRGRDGDGDIRRLYGVYHPFFVRGDLNDDGILDFVLAFVRRDSGRDSPWFSVVVFTGRAGSGFNPGAFIERDVTLARGDLSIDRDAVLITPDLGDEAVRRYRWDPLRRSYVFVRDDDEEGDPPISSRT